MPAADPGTGSPDDPFALTLPDDVLFARAPGAILAVDAHGVIRLANPAAAQLWRRDASALVGASVHDLVHPDDDAIAPALRSAPGETVAHEVRVVLPDGTLVRTLFHVVAHGGGYVAFVEDLTDHLRSIADAELSTEARYERLLQNIDDVITVCDADGTVLANLGHYNELLGWPSSYWEGRPVFDFAHPDEVDDARGAFDLLRRMPGVPIIRDFRTRDRSGRWAWLQFTATNLLDDPTVGAIVLVSRNVTRKKENERLQQNQAEIFELIACAARSTSCSRGSRSSSRSTCTSAMRGSSSSTTGCCARAAAPTWRPSSWRR